MGGHLKLRSAHDLSPKTSCLTSCRVYGLCTSVLHRWLGDRFGAGDCHRAVPSATVCGRFAVTIFFAALTFMVTFLL